MPPTAFHPHGLTSSNPSGKVNPNLGSLAHGGGPILLKRIPSWPYADPKGRHTVHIDEYLKTGGYEGLKKAIAMKPDAVTEEVKKSVLRGRGGAGFPTGLKWTFLPKLKVDERRKEDDPGQRYLAVNADESEPGTFKDRLLMDFDPHLMLEGIAIACYACRIKTAFIFIRGEYHHQAHVLEEAIKEAYAKGIFGGTGLLNGASTGRGGPWKVDCYVHRGAGAYVCGEETGLLEALEGKRGWPRIKPPFPAVKGLFGKPTIINNVETLCHVPSIIEFGADWFMKHGVASTFAGAPGSHGTKLMGVSGHVNRPGVFELELGIPLRVSSKNSAAASATARSSRAPSPAASPWESWGRTSTTPKWTLTSAESTTSWAWAPPAPPSSTKTPTWSPSPATSPASSSTSPAASAPPAAKAPAGSTNSCNASKKATPRPRTWTSPSKSPPAWAPCPAPPSAASPTATTGPSAPS